MYLDEAVGGILASLTSQANEQWAAPPALHPKLTVRFWVRDRRGDRDNKLTALLDCLHSAGVIVNDNIAKFNGTLTILPAIVDKDERVLVEIET